jgi:hypothetical protein
MSAALYRSKTRRTAALVGAVTLGLVTLSACEKPTPRATVTVGSSSVSAEAACYNDGKALDQKKLRECIGGQSHEKLTAHDGERIRIGVDPKIAKSGWVVVVNGQPTMSEKSTATYRSFNFDEVFAPQQSPSGAGAAPKKAQVTIIGLTEGGQANGTWQFTVNKAS